MTTRKTILHKIRDQDDDEMLELSVDFTLTVADFRKAVLHGRAHKLDYERDAEWGALIIAAALAGMIVLDTDDTRLTVAPEPLFDAPDPR